MKNLKIYMMLLPLMLVVVTGCNKKAATAVPKGEKEMSIPCTGKGYMSDKKAFRASAIGESRDQMTAKRKALTTARNELASTVNTLVKTVTDNYVNSREFNNKEEVLERFESLNREVVEQRLQGVVTICERYTQTSGKNAGYKVYVALELTMNDLVSAYNERLSKDERLRIDYDYEKFKQTFEAEMNRFGN